MTVLEHVIGTHAYDEKSAGLMKAFLAVHGTQVCAPPEIAACAFDALHALEAALMPPVVRDVIIAPGDLLLMSNVIAVHADDTTPGRRWHQRVYYRESLSGLRNNAATADARLTRRFHTRYAMAAGS